MSIKCFNIAIIWIFAVGCIGFSESFPNRPTAGELNDIVALGRECAKGVNERCWATQYQTNPIQYQVSPFTNDSCWYLDQNLMGQMASKARSLVQYYVNPDTVYNGTTNITMLTVAGVWADMDIGDQINQFTLTPASGTNSATYGDSPWRMYPESLEERYEVLEALKMIKLSPHIIDLWARVGGPNNGTNWATERSLGEADFNAASFIKNDTIPGEGIGSFEAVSFQLNPCYRLSISRMTGTVYWVFSSILSSETGNFKVLMKPVVGKIQYTTNIFDSNGLTLDGGTNWSVLANMSIASGTSNMIYSFPSISGLPNPTPNPYDYSDGGTKKAGTYRGYQIDNSTFWGFASWNFQYCTGEY